MKIYKYEIEVVPPVDATDEQVSDWVEFCLGCRGRLPLSNPLAEHDLECNDVIETQ